MMQKKTVHEILAIPDTCFLGKRIFKKLFYEKGQLNSADKQMFTDDIEEIEWLYTLKPETINIPRYIDEEREYVEVAVILVVLNETKRYKRIAQIIQRAIPYPVLVVSVHSQLVAFNVASKRTNKADGEKITIEDFYNTPWIDCATEVKHEQDFLSSLTCNSLSYNDFYDFYSDLTERLIANNCAYITGDFTVGESSALERSERIGLLQEYEGLQLLRVELRSKLKKEKNLGTQVQLNTKVKKISDLIAAIRIEL